MLISSIFKFSKMFSQSKKVYMISTRKLYHEYCVLYGQIYYACICMQFHETWNTSIDHVDCNLCNIYTTADIHGPTISIV